MDKRKIRRAVQAGWGLLTNAHLPGFITGRIYSGSLKRFCVPGMNCYACPGALGACPIGSMQNFFSARRPRFAAYVIGFLSLIGVLVGRLICGWLCLFGLFQELLYTIPTPKISVPERTDRILRYLKYAVLAVFVILLPYILRDELNISAPYFCKWICPVGALEGGIPLVLLDQGLRQAAHFLFAWKVLVLAAVIVLSVLIHRPFCKYICPLGAFYGLFQKISFLRLTLDKNRCTGCGACRQACRMQVDPVRNPDSAECIRCGECVQSCPAGALQFHMTGSTKQKRPAAGKPEGRIL